MKTILAIDLGKRNSVFCKLETSSLKPEYSTKQTDPQLFHDIILDLDPALCQLTGIPISKQQVQGTSFVPCDEQTDATRHPTAPFELSIENKTEFSFECSVNFVLLALGPQVFGVHEFCADSVDTMQERYIAIRE